MAIEPPEHPDPEVMRVVEAIRKLTPEQWESVRERLEMCSTCGAIGGGAYCCYNSYGDD